MIVELRKKSQITLPKEIVKELNLLEGDKFEVSINDGIIALELVAVYPKEYLRKLESEIQVLKESQDFKHDSFDNIDDLMKSLKDKWFMYRITYTKRFLKSFKKLSNSEQQLFQKKMEFFIKDTLHPSLRTKKINGHKDLYESSIDMRIRIIWYFENEELIVLVDIGYHDVLNKY